MNREAEANTPKFAENHVKAAAEFSWWYRARKRTLLEEFNLTEEQFEEIQSTSEYKARVFNLMLENRSAEAFEKWITRHKRNDEKHGRDEMQGFAEQMGLDPEDVRDMVEQVRQAHADIAAGSIPRPWRL